MARRGVRNLLLRALVFQAFFLVLHFAYGWWPNGFTALFSGTDESVFQHMKAGFYAWLLSSAVEWLAWRPSPFGDFAACLLVLELEDLLA